MTCTSCGRAAPDGSRFCPWCAQSLAAAAGGSSHGASLALTAVSNEAETTTAPATEGFLAETGTGRQAGSLTGVDPFAERAVINSRYRIERILGRGGMGIVYLAHDQRLEHRVALKCFPVALAGDERRLAQFHNEVRLARQISHPNVCRVYDIGDANDQLFLTMEYIDGRDLAQMLASAERFSEQEAVELLRGVCAGMAAVHARGVLHRDLKPANVMISQSGKPQLMDFGIAGMAVDLRRGDQLAEGTLAYMAPELLAGGNATVRSDIYALGHVMYETFTGERLLSAKTLGDLQQQHLEAAATASSRLASVVSPRIREAVVRCLDPDPARRPGSVQDVMVMLQTVLLDERIGRPRRLLQIAEQAVVFIPMVFVIQWPQHLLSLVAAAAIAAAVAAIIERHYPLGWTVTYKGHTIRVQNHAFLGERLYIDGRLVDRGRFRRNVTLRGTIETGGGAGERITADTQAGVLNFSCRMVAQAFVPGEHS